MNQGQRGAEGAESANQFVGADYEVGRHSGTEQRRHDQHPTAAGDGVNKASQQGAAAQQQEGG